VSTLSAIQRKSIGTVRSEREERVAIEIQDPFKNSRINFFGGPASQVLAKAYSAISLQGKSKLVKQSF
jgi:hypothetical protein